MSRTPINGKCARVSYVALCLGAIAATVLGCGWPGTDHTVRFNTYRKGRDFGRLPPLPKYEASHQTKLFRWEEDVEPDYEEEESDEKKIDEFWDEAVKAEEEVNLALVRKKLTAYLGLTSSDKTPRYVIATDLQKRRNSAIDKLDAMTALDQGASVQTVNIYLQARSEFDKGDASIILSDSWSDVVSDKRLKDNAAYLCAAHTYIDNKAKAAEEFARLAASYPQSEKREASLYMAAVALMKTSNSYSGLNASESSDACEDCRDEFWHKARAGFERVMREYPHGRYYSDARGWLARLSLRVGDRVNAVAEYYRMLGDKDQSGRIEALFSLNLVRDDTDELELERVERLLEREPAAALAYAYHSIYNVALKPLSADLRYEEQENDSEEKNKEIKRVAAFATRLMNRHTGAAVGGAFTLRVAEANFELGNDKEATSLARRALGMNIKDDVRAEALWVMGVADYRLKQFESARKALTTLVTENPDNRYTEGARRNLAMLAEDMGDKEGALDQYLALDYRLDVAYFVDVLLTADELAAFINRRPQAARRDELLYSLGVRYLRDRRWNDARQTLSKVRTLGKGADDDYLSRYDHYYSSSDNDRRDTMKDEETDPNIRGIRPQWVDQDLRSANDLERLERGVEIAEGDEAKAEALYQYASYQYQGSLLFYNPLWRGRRHYWLYDFDLYGNYRQPNESQLLFEYMQKHDSASRALPFYLEVARQYPKTRAARDALYTAAVCHERLAEYNNYWRAIYQEGGHAGERLVRYGDVRAAYPNYRFPRGTSGWEPMTRTVNGGPGFDALPKPKPRPSRWARALNIGNAVIVKGVGSFFAVVLKILGTIWRAIVACVLWVCHWLWIIYLLLWIRFLWRRARESRMLMRKALEGCEARPKVESDEPKTELAVGLFSSVAGKYMGRDLRDEWIEQGTDMIYKLRQVVRQKRGGSLIVLYAATHGLLVVLLFRLWIDL